MDEYLFTVLAKLKADKLKLQQREGTQPLENDQMTESEHRSPKARRSPAASPDLSWVVSTHGLRGWS